MQRVLRGTAATIRWTKLGQDGEAVAAGAATVEVRRANGTELVAATATQVGDTANERTFTLTTTHTALLDNLKVLWTDGATQETHVEIVGGFLFSLAEARSTDSSMEDPGKVLAEEMLTARYEVEQEFEEICEVAFVPRFRRATLRGPLILPDKRIRTLRSVTLDTTALTADELAKVTYDHGILSLKSTTRPVTVEYEHGYDSPPADVRRAAITRLRSRVFASKSGIPDRATSFSVTEGGTYRLSTPGENRTGIPEVDAVLERYQERDAVVA